MKNRWISSLLGGLILLGILAGPAQAALCPGDFMPWLSVGREKPWPSAGSREYVVKKGDTLWAICRENRIDLSDVLRTNDLTEKAVLSIGQTLQLPGGLRTHIVKAGDTFSALAPDYEISVGALLDANRDKNPACLKIGDTLIIPAVGTGSQDLMVSSIPSRGNGLGAALLKWPVTGRTITSPYGWRKSGFHHGIDIAGKTGNPIMAAADGVVAFTGTKAVYGRTVLITHDDGRQTLYAHLQNISVSPKQRVRQGQIIATMGLTGNTTGPHLHFEVKVDGKNVNPMNFLQ